MSDFCNSGKTLLVALPWGLADIPSIQVAALKSYLLKHNIHAEARHYHKDIIGYIGSEVYEKIMLHTVGDEAIAALMFPERYNAIKEYFLKEIDPQFHFDVLVERLNAFVEDVVEEIASQKWNVIGFTISPMRCCVAPSS